MEQNNCVRVGAWGGNGGKRWNDGAVTGVRQIKLVYYQCIDSIVVIYDKQGQQFKAKKHGGHGGIYTAEIKLDYPDEFLIGVSGHYGLWHSYVCIRSLTFKSNHRTFGPYGVEEGSRFTFSSYPLYEIVGFHGSSGEFLDSIGLHLSHAKPRTLLPKIKKLQDETERSIVVEPWGGTGGINWDDGSSFTGVRSITLFYGISIDAISVVYDDQGLPFKTDKHGGRGGKKTAEIMLQHQIEFLISVSGHYGPMDGYRKGSYIRSLTFQTSRRTFGPYGVEEGTPFTLAAAHGRRILGFKGRSGRFLDAIGFHLSDM